MTSEGSSVTLCALFYGDHLKLAHRCLQSIKRALHDGHIFVSDIRLGLNGVSDATAEYINEWSRDVYNDFDLPVTMYVPTENTYKYPTMRRMFFDDRRKLSKYVMWFDDDTYLENPLVPDPTGRSKYYLDWWEAMLSHIKDADMIGQHWLMPFEGSQKKWVVDQPWSNSKIGPPKKKGRKSYMEFCQGSWWVIHSEILVKYDWPVPEIRHNGGDSMLGELLRHNKLRMAIFHGGVRINADENGKHSGSKRRGFSEKKVGWNYKGVPLDISHQNFYCDRRTIPPDSAMYIRDFLTEEPVDLFSQGLQK